MAHFALINEDNIVVHVSPVDNSIATNEQSGINHLNKVHKDLSKFGTGAFKWMQISYNHNFAGVGYLFIDGKFINPKEK